MSTEAELSGWPLFAEGTDANQQDLSFESFEKDIGDIEFDLSFFQFPDSFPIFPGTTPAITSPSSLTYSTESDTPSQYSNGFSPSDYSTHSDVVVTPGLVEQSVYTTHDSVYSDGFTHDPCHPSFGSLPPSPSLHPIKAKSDFGTSLPYQGFFGISPEEPSNDLQQSAMSPAFLPMQVMPGTQTNTTSAKPFKCPYCPFGKSNALRIYDWLTLFLLASKRKYNLRTHISTHDKKNSKRFICDTCFSGFTRKHDLRRHLRANHTMHDDLKSSSSTYSGSAVDLGLTAGLAEDFMMAYVQVE